MAEEVSCLGIDFLELQPMESRLVPCSLSFEMGLERTALAVVHVEVRIQPSDRSIGLYCSHLGMLEFSTTMQLR